MGKTTSNADTDKQAKSIAGRGYPRPATNSEATQAVEIDFSLLFSAIYHDLCEARFMRYHRFLTATNVLLGSGAAVAIGNQFPQAATVMAMAVAIVSSVQLVWDFGGTGRDHAFLRQRYYELQADLQRGKPVEEVEAFMTGLFGSEPPIVERLRRKAHNRAGKSLYGDDFDKA